LEEKQLVKLAKGGDRRAFEALVSSCAKEIYNLALRLCGDRHKAQDIAQDAFVNAYKSIASFREDSPFSAWVRRIAVNAWKNTVRYEIRRFFTKHDSLDDNYESDDGEIKKQYASSDPPADKVLEDRQKNDNIYAVLALLNPDAREMIVLRDMEEKSYEEIAAMTGLNEGTVKSRIARAREAFKQKFIKMQGDKNES